MKLIRDSILGFVLGATYAFISYYLLTPHSGTTYIQIVFWGAQGIFFALTFKIIDRFLSQHLLLWLPNRIWIKKACLWSVCGLLVGASNAIFNYELIALTYKATLPTELRMSLTRDSMQIGCGFLFIGIFIGLLLGYFEWREQEKGQVLNHEHKPQA